MSKKTGKASQQPASSSGKALPPIKPAYAAPPMPVLANSSSAPSLSVKRRKELLVKEREDSWRISPSAGIPKYSAELDPHCPTGQVKKFNDDNRIAAMAVADMKKTSQWAKSAVESTFQDVPLKVNVSLRTKAMNAMVKQNNQDAYAEVEILQKIIIRENLLKELHKLVKTKHDIVTNLGEIVELVKALRYQTVDIIEDISAWQDVQTYPKPFLYKELNYLVKIKCDLDFLDLHEEVVERFCFEFKSNPLAYRGGGNIITGFESSNFSSGNEFRKGYVNNYYDPVESAYVDDIEIVRLHNAEKVIQKEFNRLAHEKKHPVKIQPQQSQQHHHQHHQHQQQQQQQYHSDVSKQLSHLQIDAGSTDPGLLMLQSLHSQSPDAFESQPKSSSKKSASAAKSSASPSGGGFGSSAAGSSNIVPSQRKLKAERIATLTEEANEFKSMMAHIEEQVNVLVEQHRAAVETRKAYESKQKEAVAQGRENTALRIAAEVTVIKNDLLEINKRIKDLQKESYFIGLERKRKLGTIHQLQMELDESKRKEQLKKKIEAKIKKEGLLSALKSFSSNANDFAEIVMQSAEEEGKSPKKVKTTSKRPKSGSTKKTKTEGFTVGNPSDTDGPTGETRDDMNTSSNQFTRMKKKTKEPSSSSSDVNSAPMVFANSPQRWLNQSGALTTHQEGRDDDDLEEPHSGFLDDDSQYDGQGESYLGQDSYVGRDVEEDDLEGEEEGEGVELEDGIEGEHGNIEEDEADGLELSGDEIAVAAGASASGVGDGNHYYDSTDSAHYQQYDGEVDHTALDYDHHMHGEDAAGEGVTEGLDNDYHHEGVATAADTGDTVEDDAYYAQQEHQQTQQQHQHHSELPPTYHQSHFHQQGNTSVSPLRTSGDSGVISHEDSSLAGLSLQYSGELHDDQSTVFGLDSPQSQLLQFSVDSVSGTSNAKPPHSGSKQFQSPSRYAAGGEHYNYISDSDNEDDVLSHSGQQQYHMHSGNAASMSPLNSIQESNDSPQHGDGVGGGGGDVLADRYQYDEGGSEGEEEQEE